MQHPSIVIIVAALLFPSLLAAQHSPAGKSASPAPNVFFEAGSESALESVRAVVKTPADFIQLRAKLGRATDGRSLPSVDFATDMLLVAGLGMLGGPVGSIRVLSTRDHDNILEVNVLVRLPAGPCTAPAVVVHPAVVVRVPQTRSTPIFRDSVQFFRCTGDD